LPFAEALVVGLEQPMLRRGPILSSAHSSAAPSMSRISSRNERSEAPGA
jgi:hypothetical protein